MSNILVPLKEYWVDLNVLDIRPNTYEISNYGNIRRIEDKFPIKQQILLNEYGAYRIANLVTIYSSQPKKYLVHRLVALVFVPNPYNYPEVNHVNNNGMDNCDTNLSWVTSEYNTNYQNITYNLLLGNLENYQIYKFIENGYSNEFILNNIHTRFPVDNKYIEMIRESYIRNNPESEYDFEKRRVNSARFSNETTAFICNLFQSGLKPKDFREIAKSINLDISDIKASNTFYVFCRNLYNRKHHTHISKDYSW